VTNDDGRITVYLLHGIYGAKEYWLPLARTLAQAGYRVIAWNAPGYGFATPPQPFTFDVVAEAGARLIRATGSERNVVFGHSMGGQITPRILQKVPERVHAAVITSTIGYFGNRTPAEQEQFVKARTAAPAPGTDPREATLAVVNSMFAAGSQGPAVDLVRIVAAQTPPATVQAAVKAIQANTDDQAVAAFKAIEVPTLLVAGELDHVGYPAGMQRIAQMISDSEFAVVSASGHYPWAENPADFAPLLLDFLGRHLRER